MTEWRERSVRVCDRMRGERVCVCLWCARKSQIVCVCGVRDKGRVRVIDITQSSSLLSDLDSVPVLLVIITWPTYVFQLVCVSV